jgi:hypothetical protein
MAVKFAPLTFEQWWQKWGDTNKKLAFKEAMKAIEELEELVEVYCTR